jgi:UDP-glucose 4-epimerase
MKRHLILGGTGFIGRHVSWLLAHSGHHVTVVSRGVPSFQFPPQQSGVLLLEQADLLTADWERLIADIDVVHHYAWSSIPSSANANPAGDLYANVGSTLGLLDAIKRRSHVRLVFASSGGTVYGKLRHIPVPEEEPLAPITAYGAGKATAETYIRFYQSMYGLDCRIARIANPYGVGQDLDRGLGAITTFLNYALTAKTITIWGDGEVIRDYIHISDVARCLVKLACAPNIEGPAIFNVGSGQGHSLNQIVAALREQLSLELKVNYTATRAFDVPVSILAIDRAQAMLGWTPRLSFAEGIKRTIDDMLAQRKLSTVT